MKKMMLTLAIVVSSLGAVFASEPLASNREQEVSAKVLDAFQTEFRSAKDIKWTVASNYFQASFVYNEQHVTAYYTTEGQLMGLTRNISPADLPLSLQSDLKRNFGTYWISDLFEVSSDDGTAYYITVEDADVKKVLKATDGKYWYDYKKVKKA